MQIILSDTSARAAPGAGASWESPLGELGEGGCCACTGVCGRSWSEWLPQAAVLAARGLGGGEERMYTSSVFMS